jgi:hypothetical protein
MVYSRQLLVHFYNLLKTTLYQAFYMMNLWFKFKVMCTHNWFNIYCDQGCIIKLVVLKLLTKIISILSNRNDSTEQFYTHKHTGHRVWINLMERITLKFLNIRKLMSWKGENFSNGNCPLKEQNLLVIESSLQYTIFNH